MSLYNCSRALVHTRSATHFDLGFPSGDACDGSNETSSAMVVEGLELTAAVELIKKNLALLDNAAVIAL